MGLRGPLERAAELIRPEIDDVVIIPEHGIEDMEHVVALEWDDFWRSKVSRFTDDVDMGTLRRLFTYRNEWVHIAKLWADLDDEERLVAGSRNEDAVRLHPYATRLAKLEALMLPLEDRFGLSPLSRARLGIEVGSLHLTWAQISQQAANQAAIEKPVLDGLPVAGAEVVDDPDS